jgi:hypothetical protein
MPITFEPAAPTGVNAAASYGAAQQNAQDVGATAGIYEAAARNQLQQNLAGQELAQRSQEAATHAQLAAQGQQFQAQHAADQTALGYATLQQHSSDIDRHAEATAWLNRQELTAADTMRMQRLQQGVSEVEDAFQQGKIDPDTRTNMLLQIKTGLDPLRMKFEQQQAAHLQQQDKLLDMQIQRQAAHEATAREFEAKMMTGGQEWAWYPDDNGKRHPLVKNPRTGEWYNPLLSNGGKAGGDQVQAKAEEAAYTRWEKAHDRAMKVVDGWATAHDKDGKPLYPQYRDTDAYTAQVDALMAKAGHAPTWTEEKGKFAAGRGGTSLPAGDQGAGGDYGGGQGQGAAADPAAGREQFAKDNPPFADPAAATPAQRQVLQGFAQTAQRMQILALPDGEGGQARQAMQRAQELVQRYGAPERMPEADRQYLQQVRDMAARIDAQVATAEAEKKKFIAGQGTRLDRGAARLGIPLNPKVR